MGHLFLEDTDRTAIFLLCPKTGQSQSWVSQNIRQEPFLGMKFVGFPFLHDLVNNIFFILIIFSFPLLTTFGRGKRASRPMCGIGWPCTPAINLFMTSLSPGGSSRTCRTMHLTKSPTSSSWSKYDTGPCLSCLPSLLPCFSYSLPTLFIPRPDQAGPMSLVFKPSCLFLIGLKS